MLKRYTLVARAGYFADGTTNMYIKLPVLSEASKRKAEPFPLNDCSGAGPLPIWAGSFPAIRAHAW